VTILELHKQIKRTMKITSRAMSYISLPSPSKSDPFRGGPSPKDKRKSRFITRALSAPLRRMGRQLSKRSSRNSPRNDKPGRTSEHDIEQGWIAPVATFETEDTLSPRSLDSSLTARDTSSFLVQTEEKEEILNYCIVGSSQQIQPDQFLDLETAVNESAETSVIFRMENDVQDDTHDILYNENMTRNYEKQNAAPKIVTNVHEVFREYTSMIDDDSTPSMEEDTRDRVVSLLSRIDTTVIIEEDDEIDSLVPAADISFFLDEEKGDDFHCVGRISALHNEAPPVEIDVDRESIGDLTNNSRSEDENQGPYIEDDDDISSTSSYNSYLQAIGSITASASSRVERAMTMATDKIEIKTPAYTPPKVVFETPSYPPPKFEFEQEPEIEKSEDCYRVSFTPSNELLLQAMEGASAKAKIDIERATALALSKINSAKFASSKRESFNKSHTTPKYAPNRAMGFLFVLFVLLNLNGTSYRFFRGIRSLSHSAGGIDDFQMQPRNDIVMRSHPDLSMWGDKQMVAKPNKTQVAMIYEPVYNVGCIHKLGCLALGNL